MAGALAALLARPAGPEVCNVASAGYDETALAELVTETARRTPWEQAPAPAAHTPLMSTDLITAETGWRPSASVRNGARGPGPVAGLRHPRRPRRTVGLTMAEKQAAPESARGTDGGIFAPPYLAATLTFAVVMFLTGSLRCRGTHRRPPLTSLPAAAAGAGGAGGPAAGGVPAARWVSVLTSWCRVQRVRLAAAAGRFVDGLAARHGRRVGDHRHRPGPPRAPAPADARHDERQLGHPDPARPAASPVLVVQWWSWRAVFYGLAVLTALPAVALVAVLRKPRPTRRRPHRPRRTGRPPPLLVVPAPCSAWARPSPVRRLRLGPAPPGVRRRRHRPARRVRPAAAAARHLAQRPGPARPRCRCAAPTSGT
ncbi:hypothetical protein LT493_09015 [Streptomyces tricolor]|nr:hypothetical protein [Streptomyces tricolor]